MCFQTETFSHRGRLIAVINAARVQMRVQSGVCSYQMGREVFPSPATAGEGSEKGIQKLKNATNIYLVFFGLTRGDRNRTVLFRR
jgi:hypothetical protein